MDVDGAAETEEDGGVETCVWRGGMAWMEGGGTEITDCDRVGKGGEDLGGDGVK